MKQIKPMNTPYLYIVNPGNLPAIACLSHTGSGEYPFYPYRVS